MPQLTEQEWIASIQRQTRAMINELDFRNRGSNPHLCSAITFLKCAALRLGDAITVDAAEPAEQQSIDNQ